MVASFTGWDRHILETCWRKLGRKGSATSPEGPRDPILTVLRNETQIFKEYKVKLFTT